MNYENGLSMEERVTSLFQPDTLLPEQYLETFRRKLHLEPEKKLMLAILEDAVACFQKYLLARDGKGKTLFRETEEWVLEDRGDWLFSFANVCDLLKDAHVFPGPSASMPVAYRDTLLSRAIGRALAHEIGHYLFASKVHTPAGLMKAVHSAVELFSPTRGHFMVTAAEQMRVVARRTAVEMASISMAPRD